MPVNLLSTGMLQMMLPTASRWLHQHGAVRLYARLLRFCAVMSVLIICYFGIMWALRDWIFANILKKQFPDRDALLFLWCLICLCMMLRDQLASLLVVSGRLRQMSTLTLVSATLALTASYLCIRQFGVMGALIGVLTGEVINVAGIAVLSAIESKRAADSAADST
jgi:O-antigen/teichoic acid export membrane protein